MNNFIRRLKICQLCFIIFYNIYRQNSRHSYSYKPQSEIDKAELARRNRELIAKIQEVDDLKTQYEEALGSIDPIATGTSRVSIL